MSNGQSIVIKGDISGSEDLVIAGRVEGSITLNGRVLTLAAGSHVVGEIEAGTVVVSGQLEGKDVGRITSAARDPELGIVALAYVRREVDAGAPLTLPDGRAARSAPA